MGSICVVTDTVETSGAMPPGFGTYVGVEVANFVHREHQAAKTAAERNGWASLIAPCPPDIGWGQASSKSPVTAGWQVPKRALEPPQTWLFEDMDSEVWRQAVVERVLPEGLAFRPVGSELLDVLPENYRAALVDAAAELKGSATDGFVVEGLSQALSIGLALLKSGGKSRDPYADLHSATEWSYDSFAGAAWEWLFNLAPNGSFGWGVKWGGQRWAVTGSVAGSSVEFMCAVGPPDELRDLCQQLHQRLTATGAEVRLRHGEIDAIQYVAEAGQSIMFSLQESHRIDDGEANREKGKAIADAAVTLILEAIRSGLLAEVVKEGEARERAGRMTREVAEMWAAKVNRKMTMVEDSRTGVRQRVAAIGIEERKGADGSPEFGIRLTDGDVVWDRSFFERASRGCIAVFVMMVGFFVALTLACLQSTDLIH